MRCERGRKTVWSQRCARSAFRASRATRSRWNAFLSGGLPAFDIVGLGDTAVKESRERVRAAVKNCGVKFPVSRITVNLAPAGSEKGGHAL